MLAILIAAVSLDFHSFEDRLQGGFGERGLSGDQDAAVTSFGAVGLLRGVDRVAASIADDQVLAPFATVGGLPLAVYHGAVGSVDRVVSGAADD